MCDAHPAEHRFETLEHRVEDDLRQVLVRRSGDRELAEGWFDLERLTRDVRLGVLKQLDDMQVLDVVKVAVASLQTKLPGLLTPLTDEELAAHPAHSGALLDVEISNAIEMQLRRGRRRMAHVLFAMSIRGRNDRVGRLGWQSAVDVLEWLYEPGNYPDLKLAHPRVPIRPEDRWFPTSPAPLPRTVVKRSGNRVNFAFEQFVASVRHALFGRDKADETSACVAQWVLWGLAGQDQVHSSQLAIGVLDTLRRVDHIAYLRWASTAKSIDSVTLFRDEARGLLTNPSVPLVFDEKLSRPMPPSRR